MLHANFMALCYTERELLPMEVLLCGSCFCLCDLDLDPMTFIYELDLYSQMCKNEFNTSRLSKVINYGLTDRQT